MHLWLYNIIKLSCQIIMLQAVATITTKLDETPTPYQLKEFRFFLKHINVLEAMLTGFNQDESIIRFSSIIFKMDFFIITEMF